MACILATTVPPLLGPRHLVETDGNHPGTLPVTLGTYCIQYYVTCFGAHKCLYLGQKKIMNKIFVLDISLIFLLSMTHLRVIHLGVHTLTHFIIELHDYEQRYPIYVVEVCSSMYA